MAGVGGDSSCRQLCGGGGHAALPPPLPRHHLVPPALPAQVCTNNVRSHNMQKNYSVTNYHSSCVFLTHFKTNFFVGITITKSPAAARVETNWFWGLAGTSYLLQ